MSTLLPTPEAPMMKKTSPSLTSKLTPLSTVFAPNDFLTFRNEIIDSTEDQVAGAADEEVQDDHGERRVDDRARRRPTDALGTARCREPAVAADDGDRGA